MFNHNTAVSFPMTADNKNYKIVGGEDGASSPAAPAPGVGSAMITSKKDSTRAPIIPTPTGADASDVRGHSTSLPVQGQRPMMGDDRVIIPPPQRPSEAKNQRPSAFSFQKAAGQELLKRQKQLDNEQRRQEEDKLHCALLMEHRRRKLEEQILYDAKKKKKGRSKNKLPSSKLLKRANSSAGSSTTNNSSTALSGSTTVSKLLEEDEEAQLQERSPTTTTAGKGMAKKRKQRRVSEHKNGDDFDEVEYRWSFPSSKQTVARQAVNESKTVNHKNGSKRARKNQDSVVFSPSPADSRYHEEDDDRYPQAPLPSSLVLSSKVPHLYSGNLFSAVVDDSGGGAPHMWAQQPSTTTDTRSGVAPRDGSVYYQRQNYDAEDYHASPAPPPPTPVRLLVPSAGLLLMDTALVFDPAFTTPRSASKKGRSALSTNSQQKATAYETLHEEDDADDHSASFVSVYFSLLRQGGIHRSKEPYIIR